MLLKVAKYIYSCKQLIPCTHCKYALSPGNAADCPLSRGARELLFLLQSGSGHRDFRPFKKEDGRNNINRQTPPKELQSKLFPEDPIEVRTGRRNLDICCSWRVGSVMTYRRFRHDSTRLEDLCRERCLNHFSLWNEAREEPFRRHFPGDGRSETFDMYAARENPGGS